MFCKYCKKEKSISEFDMRNKSRCISCLNAYAKERQRKAKENIVNTRIINENDLVYFILAPEVNRVKIGYTKDGVDTRLKNIEGQSPCFLEPIGTLSGDTHTERELHKKFKKFHHHNEWFLYTKEIQDYIFENCVKNA